MALLAVALLPLSPHGAAARVARGCDPAGLHVSPIGRDDADGSAAHPYRTPARALQALQAAAPGLPGAALPADAPHLAGDSGLAGAARPGVAPRLPAAPRSGAALRPGAAPRLVVLEGGTYRLDAPLSLGAGGDGVVLRGCPAGAAVLDGGGRLPLLLALEAVRGVRLEGLSLTGTAPGGVAVRLRRAQAAVLSGLRVRAVGTGVLLEGSGGSVVQRCSVRDAVTGIELKDGSDGDTLRANTLEDLHGQDTAGGGVFLHGASDTLIERNLVRRTRGMGIGVSNWDEQTVSLRNVVRRNVVRDVDREASDSGAIYLLGRSGRETGSVVEGNVVDGAGPPAAHTVGIYLDDSTSGVLVRGNVLRRQGQIALQVHGGSDNRIEGNLVELGRLTRTAVLFQAAPADTHPTGHMTGNVVQGNAFTADGPARHPFVSLDGGHPAILENWFLSPPGTPMLMTPPLADARPRFERLPGR